MISSLTTLSKTSQGGTTEDSLVNYQNNKYRSILDTMLDQVHLLSKTSEKHWQTHSVCSSQERWEPVLQQYPFPSKVLINPPTLWSPRPQPPHGFLRGEAPHLYCQPSLPLDATYQILKALKAITTQSTTKEDTIRTSLFRTQMPHPYI
jgi:hypothetical protein